jgi:hypothetical protein
MIEVKEGTRWASSDGNVFHVMSVVQCPDGHTWVHYEQDNIGESRTFSCWVDSFTLRFIPILNDQYNSRG